MLVLKFFGIQNRIMTRYSINAKVEKQIIMENKVILIFTFIFVIKFMVLKL